MKSNRFRFKIFLKYLDVAKIFKTWLVILNIKYLKTNNKAQIYLFLKFILNLLSATPKLCDVA
jgi:hypothetical protein